MPIYEFYCSACHMVFNFFSRRVNTTAQPACPRCGKPKLDRQISRFAISRGSKTSDAEEDDLPPGFDETRFEQAMESLAQEMDGVDEEDPRQAAQLMRKLCESTGLPLSGAMEEAVRRMEAGEDPDEIEEELGDLLEEEDPFLGEGPKKLRHLTRQLRPPKVDDTLYELD